MLRIVTANRLRDGRVVFLGAGNGWVEDLAHAQVAAEAGEAEALEQAAERAVDACQVVAPYLIDVVRDGDALRAAALREAIRATGPTVGPDTKARR